MALLFGLGIVAPVPVVRAVRAADFLASLGANSGINGRGERLERTIECAKYLGLRWFRSGTEGDPAMADLLRLRREAGVRFSWSPGSGGSDLSKLLATARELARADALLAFEGPNEPNNWGIVYRGEKGGGRDGTSWKAVAAFQRDLYAAVKADPRLRRYPVWGISETGAENDNVGLQFLTVPRGAGTLLPDGTRYADAANCHNYVYHPNSPGVEPNKTWNAADPSPACKVDGLFGNHGLTWLRKFPGYSEKDLRTLPRVTTETGCTIGGPVTEEIHARNLLTLYLDQFKRGWSHTAVYLLRDRIDEGGNQAFGFYRADDTPRRAALYLHNLTTVLDDRENDRRPGGLAYRIEGASPTVHDLLLQKRDGSFALVVWAERTEGTDRVTLRFGKPSGAVRLYDPTAGTGATEVLGRTDALRLSLSDHPIIVELKG